MTFSLVARCSETGMFGVAISSSSPAVAARCAYARAGVGAVASQNITDPSLGPKMLDALARGLDAKGALREVIAAANHADYRQVLSVDGKGGAAGGNLLANDMIPQVLVDAFTASRGHLGNRLVEAMRAGLAAGGEAGPVHSSGMMLVDKVSWPVADLRCDWTDDCPIEALASLWERYKPQLDAYVTRALDPREAPSYGVPGDE